MKMTFIPFSYLLEKCRRRYTSRWLFWNGS